MRSFRAIRWAPHRMFKDDFAEDLKHDMEVINAMLERFGTWGANRDGKIAALQNLLTDRYPDSKVLIFAEAAATAGYVCEELLRRGDDASGWSPATPTTRPCWLRNSPRCLTTSQCARIFARITTRALRSHGRADVRNVTVRLL